MNTKERISALRLVIKITVFWTIFIVESLVYTPTEVQADSTLIQYGTDYGLYLNSDELIAGTTYNFSLARSNGTEVEGDYLKSYIPSQNSVNLQIIDRNNLINSFVGKAMIACAILATIFMVKAMREDDTPEEK